MLHLESIRKMSGKRCVIEHATMFVCPGEIICLAGPSGIGKTTILEIIAGLVRPDSGKVERSCDVSLAFQDDVLLPWLTAYGNIEYILSELSPSERTRRIVNWLDKFDLTPEQYPASMSGGMRRRLNLARAFAPQRKILLLDEPYAFLDKEWQERVSAFIACEAQAGAAVVLSSHQLAPLRHLKCTVIEIDASPIILMRNSLT